MASSNANDQCILFVHQWFEWTIFRHYKPFENLEKISLCHTQSALACFNKILFHNELKERLVLVIEYQLTRRQLHHFSFKYILNYFNVSRCSI